ncbi:MAG: hypothetical protein RL063_986 [Pseudomonadota bacterium]|jgi:hypothetical protein
MTMDKTFRTIDNKRSLLNNDDKKVKLYGI